MLYLRAGGLLFRQDPPPPLLEPKKEHKVRVRGGGCLLSA